MPPIFVGNGELMVSNKSVASACALAGFIAAMLIGIDVAASPAATNLKNFRAGQTSPLKNEYNPKIDSAINRGLKWLAARQNSNGSFDSGSTAITSLGALAFVAGGNLPNQGPYGRNVSRALHYVLAHCHHSGLIAAQNDGTPMYSQGFSTLFLAEIYGESHAAGLRNKLQKAVRLIVDTQNSAGGWRYQPVVMPGDLSVTICQVMALRAARQAGIGVPRRTMRSAISFVRRLQNPDGGFSYMLGMSGSDFARSAAGVALLFYSGVYKGSVIGRAVNYVNGCLPGTPLNMQGNYFYGNYYGTQAMFLAGGKWWAHWWPAMSKNLLSRQQSNGAWVGGAGSSYGTAMALIILQIPKRLLPILQK